MSGQATVWVRPLNGAWQPIGTAADRGVWHENLTLTSDAYGPKSATFTLYRSARGLFPDLLADTPVMVEVAGVRVWAGRISDAPEQSGAARQIGVTCDGWQAHLDDDVYGRTYVHTDLTAYQDSRTILTAALSTLTQAWNVATDNGVITLGLASGASAAIGTAGGVTLDLGPASTAKRIVITWDSSNNGGTNISFRARGSNDPNVAAGGSDAINFTLNGGASGTTAGTFSTDCRYVHLFLVANAALAPGSDLWLKVKTSLVVADTAYESGNASVLTADMIIKDALTRATTLLSADRTGIGAPAVVFPDFTMDAPQTPRQVITTANAPNGWQFKIDEYQRPVYREPPTAPVVDFGNWPGNESDGGSSNSAEGIVTKVIVTGTAADGSPVVVTRTQTGTIIDRQGGVRTQIITSSLKLDTDLADDLGDSYLAAHKASPFKGTVAVSAGGARRTLGGALHPAHLLLLTGELARHTALIDPDTGGVGRGMRIVQVAYDDDAGTSSVALDNTRTDFDTEMARRSIAAA